jgi:nitronate monooxygenase/enoyl-[acyl-carrier protein] reductase II
MVVAPREVIVMLRTRLCEVLGIEVPIIQAEMGPWSPTELAAAASNAGALGSLGAAMFPAEHLRVEIWRLHSLTDRPFAINFTSTGIMEGAHWKSPSKHVLP